MTTVQFDGFSIQLSQPLENRPEVLVIAASDGRRTILGDGQDPFTPAEYEQMESTGDGESVKRNSGNCERLL